MGLKSVKSIKNVNELKKDKKNKETFGEFNLGKTLYIVISLVLTIVLFIGMLYLRDRLSNDITYDSVVTVKKACPEGEVITSKNADTYFTIAKIPSENNIAGTYTKIKDLVNNKSKVNLEVGEIVANKDFTNVNEYTDDITNPVLTSIEASGISNAACGRLRQGDIINISIITNENSSDTAGSTVGNITTSETAITFKDVYVANAKDSSGADIAATDTTTAATVFSLILDQDDSAQLNDALNKGSLIRIEKVLSNSKAEK